MCCPNLRDQHTAQAVKIGDETFSAAEPWTAAMRCRISSRALLVKVRQRIATADALANQPAGALGERARLPGPRPREREDPPERVIRDLLPVAG
jgi:hypothetical protein